MLLGPLARLAFISCFSAFALASAAHAYVLEGGKLQGPSVNVQMKLSSTAGALGSQAPAFPLADGSTSWEQVFNASVGIWNAVMADLQVTTTVSPATNLGTEDGLNEDYFGTSIAGSTLDRNTLALTIYYSDGTTIFEADTAFNSTWPWNSYRGPLLSNGVIDFRRVAIHEIGHLLGLADINGTNPLAIMDINVSNIDTLTADDIAGVQFLYGAPAGGPISVSRAPFVRGADFTGQGVPDLLWFDPSAELAGVWLLNGDAILKTQTHGPVPGGWQPVTVADFDHNGLGDILWEYGDGQRYGIWRMNGTTLIGTRILPAPSPNYALVGVADINGDGYPDILWRDKQVGTLFVWYYQGTNLIGTRTLTPLSPEWTVEGTPRVNGQFEILIRNRASGAVELLQTNGANVVQALPLGTPSLIWQIVGCGDIDGTGTDDIVWIDTTNNTLGIWYLGPAGVVSEGVVATVPLHWRFAGLENLNGTGRSSILWRESSIGYVGVWQIQGFSLTQSYILATVPPSWQIRPLTGQ